MNFHKKVEKHMYMDGFHKGKNHTLWKLKKQLTPQQWAKVKQYFNCYNHTDKECSNVKYFGWATTEPVKVMLTLEQGEWNKMIDEQFFAFTLIDLKELIRELEKENMISNEEKTEFLKTHDKLMKLGGLRNGSGEVC